MSVWAAASASRRVFPEHEYEIMHSAKGVLARIAVVMALHAALLYALLQINPDLKKQIAPIVVSLIAPPKPLPQALPPPSPPPPKPQPRQPATPVVQPAAPLAPLTPAANAISVEAPAAPVNAAAEPPAATASLAPVMSAPPAPAPAEPPRVVPPRFDAAYLNNPPPVYPAAARRRGEHGRVQLRVYVTAAGTAEQVELFRTSGSGALDAAAREAVERWRFVPARQGDRPVGAWVIVPVVFTLEG